MVTSREVGRSSQKRPLRKALTRVSKASPARSRGAPTLRPPIAIVFLFLKVELGRYVLGCVFMFILL